MGRKVVIRRDYESGILTVDVENKAGQTPVSLLDQRTDLAAQCRLVQRLLPELLQLQ